MTPTSIRLVWGIAHSEWYVFEIRDWLCLLQLIVLHNVNVFLIRCYVDIYYSWHSHTQNVTVHLEKRIIIKLKCTPWFETILISGNFVHIHKWALVIAWFYAQFKFKSFLLDADNTSVMQLFFCWIIKKKEIEKHTNERTLLEGFAAPLTIILMHSCVN